MGTDNATPKSPPIGPEFPPDSYAGGHDTANWTDSNWRNPSQSPFVFKQSKPGTPGKHTDPVPPGLPKV